MEGRLLNAAWIYVPLKYNQELHDAFVCLKALASHSDHVIRAAFDIRYFRVFHGSFFSGFYIVIDDVDYKEISCALSSFKIKHLREKQVCLPLQL